MDYNKIISHYVNNYSKKIFFKRLTSNAKDFYLMFIYEYDRELEYFADTFLKYLPFYIRNEDYFVSLDESTNIDELLVSRSKSLRRNSMLIPQRTIETDGIYGELFLDFYLRIVNRRRAVLTYANKRSFDSNYETTGPDNVVYYIDALGKINVCICEAKFVGGVSRATESLVDDIVGTSTKAGHVTKEYLNDYFQFIVEKGNNIAEADKIVLKPFFSQLNKQLDAGNNFISVIIELDICVNFIFFAIFDSTKKEPDKLNANYDKIYENCKSNVETLGFTNYRIEIVFIPTDNKTMLIKQTMEKAYE